MTIIRIGLDTSKHVFQLHGVNETEAPVLRRQLRRGEVEKFFRKLPPARIGIEACGASHHWGRVLRALGHEVALIPPQYVKPYLKRGQNDAVDAEAICEAMSRGPSAHGLVPWAGMRFVTIKSAENQAAEPALGRGKAATRGMMVRTRDLLVKQRTMLINAIRGHAAEFGVTGAKGPARVAALLERVKADASVPAPRVKPVGCRLTAREMLDLLAGQLLALEARRAALEKPLMARHREDQRSQLLGTIPGVGPIGGVSFSLKCLPPRRPGWRMQRCSARAATPACAGAGFCRLARHHPARPFDRGPAAPRPDQSARGREPAPAAGARRHRRHPPGQPAGQARGPRADGPHLALAAQFAGAQAEKARGGRAGQQSLPRRRPGMARIIWAMLVSGEVCRSPKEA